ncbi:MAG: transposase [Desulfocapsa sp.]|nr:transposase [Desulfocapsa sp.]MBU4237047.1 transposase [Pseudomonadota bacterium]
MLLLRVLMADFGIHCLNEHIFVNLHNAQQIIESWRQDYNTNRPHSSLNDMTPEEFSTEFFRK